MKLYVGNLNFETTEDELNELFSSKGSIQSVNIITDKFTGRSKGFGFVEFEESDAAEDAISAFDGNEFKGRKIRVSQAKERERSGGGGGVGRGPRGPRRDGGGGGNRY